MLASYSGAWGLPCCVVDTTSDAALEEMDFSFLCGVSWRTLSSLPCSVVAFCLVYTCVFGFYFLSYCVLFACFGFMSSFERWRERWRGSLQRGKNMIKVYCIKYAFLKLLSDTL